MPAPTNRPAYQLFVGIDSAATTFAASWTTEGPPRERARTFPQTPAGFAALQEQLGATGIAPAHTLVVVEATGCYWIALAVALHQAGYVVSVVNPAGYPLGAAQLRQVAASAWQNRRAGRACVGPVCRRAQAYALDTAAPGLSRTAAAIGDA